MDVRIPRFHRETFKARAGRNPNTFDPQSGAGPVQQPQLMRGIHKVLS